MLSQSVIILLYRWREKYKSHENNCPTLLVVCDEILIRGTVHSSLVFMLIPVCLAGVGRGNDGTARCRSSHRAPSYLLLSWSKYSSQHRHPGMGPV